MKIIFICVANSVRSQMAEGLARQVFGPGATVRSGGSKPSSSVHPHAITVMKELDLDIAGYRPKSIYDLDLRDADYVITLCLEEVCPILPEGVKALHWPVQDPTRASTSEESLKRFREVRDLLHARLLVFKAEIGNVIYRLANPGDSTQIINFQIALAKESEGLALDPILVRQGVEAVYNNPSRGKYYVAEKDTEVVACLLIIEEWSDWRNGLFLWIHSLYVKEGFRRRGIFTGLYRYIQGFATADPRIKGVRLYVASQNRHARLAYHHIGLSSGHYDLYEWVKGSM